MSDDKEARMWRALKTIASYDQPERLRRNCEQRYGLAYEEALEMAYENMIGEAKAAIHGMRKPKP